MSKPVVFAVLLIPVPGGPWVQCTQCGWGLRCTLGEIEVGDYEAGRACLHCGIGPYRITVEEDPWKLLTKGPCGSRPPMVMELSRGTWWANGDKHALDRKPVARWEVQHGRRGLALAWKRSKIEAGCLRAVGPDSLGQLLHALEHLLTGSDDGQWMRKHLLKQRGTLLMLGPKGQEVTF